ncbi:hypothetical protein [Pseudomonas sp. G(2018)]|uniref:hypothetical protein n=1 Tax=Pseudomonas sp. G(2018) TaxID=2502242 RepID=UPI0010F5021A|nr:hypothetical protein [Pseudomonas sp. G(2018)]
MNDPKASHPPAPEVPAQLKSGDFVYLNGKNAGIYSGLHQFRFVGLEGAQSARLPITRGAEVFPYFEVHGSFKGKYEVRGVYVADSPIPESERSFGFTEITQAK